MSTLRLVPRDRVVDGSAQTARRFLDLEVDGQSLYDTIRRRGFDVIGAIWLEPSVDESRLLCSAGYRPICRLIASRCSCAPSAPASVAER